MTTLPVKIFTSIVAIILSIVLIFFACETFMRIHDRGFLNGIKSYFVIEPPYSSLGVNGWVVSDDTLGYRLNPSKPGVNRYSMRDHTIIVPKPAATKRVVILGDSIPFIGDPTFVTRLKYKFKDNPHIEILNASTPGYTNYQELMFLKKYILQIQPDIVILCYVTNDNYKFLQQYDAKYDSLFTQEAKDSLQIHTPLDVFISRSYFLSYLKNVYFEKAQRLKDKKSQYWWDNAKDFDTAWKDSSWPDVDNQIGSMNSLLKSQNARLFITIFPLESQTNRYVLSTNYNYVLKPQRKLAHICEKDNLPCLDLLPFFYKAVNDGHVQLYTDGLHLSDKGHEVTADVLYTFLTQHLNE